MFACETGKFCIDRLDECVATGLARSRHFRDWVWAQDLNTLAVYNHHQQVREDSQASLTM